MRKYAVAAFAAFLATPALAADKAGPPAEAVEAPAQAFHSSCYAQALGGSKVSTVEAKGYLPAAISASGWTVGGGLGCDLKMERVVVGALARIELPMDETGGIVASDKAWMAGARFGYLLNTGLMAYGLVGFTQSDLKIDAMALSKDGIVLGGGIEVMISKQLWLTAEYTQTGLHNSTLDGIEVKPVTHNARLGLTYRFNSLTGD